MRLCAWCKKDIETGKQLTDVEYKEASKEATHGMCRDCYREQINKMEGTNNGE